MINIEYLNKQEYKFGFVQENVEMVVYSVVCFFVPFFIGHPQLIVGIIVNASLVLAALNLRSYKFSISMLIRIIPLFEKIKTGILHDELLQKIIILSLSISFENKSGFIKTQNDLSQLEDEELMVKQMIYDSKKEDIFDTNSKQETTKDPYPIFRKINYEYFLKFNLTIIYLRSIGDYILSGF